MSAKRTRAQAAVIIGTRPEAIKLAPVVRELRRRGMGTVVIGTGQHRDMVADVLRLFEVELDHDLQLMRDAADLNHLLSTGVRRIGSLLGELQPRVVLVQGDTTSALAGALAAFNAGIPVAHVEAGLRSHDLALPFPEEMHRRVVSVLAQWNFAPTAHAAKQLRAEHQAGAIHVTGNTVVDAVNQIVQSRSSISRQVAPPDGAYLLATAHRRESWGEPIREIALGLRDVLRGRTDLSLIFATHPNPLARGPVEEVLANEPRATVVGPLQYDEFLLLLRGSVLAVTDSGGIQEEGPTLGVPVLVTRAVTERPEGLQAGAVNMVGTSRSAIRREVRRLLDDERVRKTMSRAGRQVYGDGQAAVRIADILTRDLEEPGP